MRKLVLLFLVLAVLVLAACGGGQPASQPAASSGGGNAANGKTLFAQPVIGPNKLPGCGTCHSIEKGKTLVGPSLAGVSEAAAAAIKDSAYKGTAKSAEEFLRESIVNPNVVVTEGFQPNIMQAGYDKLSAQELDDLVAYLMTLK